MMDGEARLTKREGGIGRARALIQARTDCCRSAGMCLAESVWLLARRWGERWTPLSLPLDSWRGRRRASNNAFNALFPSFLPYLRHPRPLPGRGHRGQVGRGQVQEGSGGGRAWSLPALWDRGPARGRNTKETLGRRGRPGSPRLPSFSLAAADTRQPPRRRHPTSPKNPNFHLQVGSPSHSDACTGHRETDQSDRPLKPPRMTAPAAPAAARAAAAGESKATAPLPALSPPVPCPTESSPSTPRALHSTSSEEAEVAR